jgi:hypothetical protein
VKIGRPIRITSTPSGQSASVRFLGYIDEWPLEWPGVVTTFATSTITASSRIARLGLSNKLRTATQEEIAATEPLHYWPLSDIAGSVTAAADASASSDAALTVDGEHGVATAPTFGRAGLATGPQTAAAFDLDDELVGPLLNLAQWSVSGFILPATVPSETEGVVFNTWIPLDGDTRYTQDTFLAHPGGITIDDGGSTILTYTVSSGSLGDAPHHFAVTYDGATSRLYVDGEEVATGTGSAMVGYGTVGSNVYADTDFAAQHYAIHDRALTADEVLAIANAGLGVGETAVDRLERYAAYADVPSAEYSFDADAVTPMTVFDTTGSSAMELMQKVAETDGGVLFDAPDGTLTYQGRENRYNATAVLTLDAAGSEVGASYAPKLDRSALINRVTATADSGAYSVTAENTASIDEYGVHSPGDLELLTTDTNHAHAAAWWRVNTYGEPSIRAPQLGVEIAALSAARQATILGTGIGEKVTVTGLPSQSDSSSKSFFVEGYSESITDSLHRIDFNVSPAAGFDVWEIEHATFGQYDAYPIAL